MNIEYNVNFNPKNMQKINFRKGRGESSERRWDERAWVMICPSYLDKTIILTEVNNTRNRPIKMLFKVTKK